MIPISDDNPAGLTPVFTWGIILACVAAFAWEFSLGRRMDAALLVFGFTPASLFAGFSPASGIGRVPAILTIFTSMFLHGGILHIAGNMLYLWIFGNNVEDAMGHARFFLFYFVCGVAAALTLGYIDPASTVPMVGASGPHDYIDMGGMFTNLKVREHLESYDKDPGWYENPPGTLASVASSDDLERDLGFNPGSQAHPKTIDNMEMDDMNMRHGPRQ